MFKPNLKALREGLQIDFDKNDEAALAASIDQLTLQLNNTMTMVTLSELGVAVHRGGERVRIPAHQREIMDVSGAGDTVIAVASLVLAAGGDPAFMAALSNLAGGLVCEKVGVVPIDKKQLHLEAVSKLTVD